MKAKEPAIQEWASITHQTQPTDSTCTHACLAMALGVPVATVVDLIGDEPLGQFDLHVLLEKFRLVWNPLVYGKLMFPGWHFATVPSLNCPGAAHCVLIWYDISQGKMVIMDPAQENRYEPNGGDLHTWSNLIMFYPGGAIGNEPTKVIDNSRN